MSGEENEKFDADALKRRVVEGAANVTERDAKRLVERENELERKFKALPGKFAKLINQVKLLFELIRAYVDGSYRQVPWGTIAFAVAAVVYFLTPIDLIPDMIPGFGLLDDVFVVRFALTMVQSDLRTFCEFKGYAADKYFD